MRKLAFVVLVSAGCLKDVQHHCTDSTSCTLNGMIGTCEPQGFCSFADPTCPSGRRFGELAGSLSKQCVGGGEGSDGGLMPQIDARPDMYVADARECFGSGAYELCFTNMPPMGTVLLMGTLDTNGGSCMAMPASWAAAGQPDACLIVGQTVTVDSAGLTVTGTRPLVIVGANVTISGLLDIASHRGGAVAPGGNATQCAAFPTTPANSTIGAGAGAGGSFMTRGGNGGRGESSGVIGGTSAAADTAAPTILRGGCPGQLGGTGTNPAGAVGAGGGAIYIAAGKLSMPNTGAINASGAGATGGGTYSGGSGAGSGGMIVIYTYQVAMGGGKLVANGGGGASGGSSSANGVSGSDPTPTAPTTPAPGGNGGGSSGGDGFAGTTQAQSGAFGQNKSGGGGGGAGGYIQSNITLIGISSSPNTTIVP